MNLGAALTDMEQAELLRRLTEPEQAYIFKHALVQETAYASLTKRERKRLHRAVAETLEQTWRDRPDEIAARLAQHYAKAGDDRKTFEYATLAGDRAARQFAYAEARVHYASALEALRRLPDDQEHQVARVDTVIKQVSVSLRAVGPAETLERLVEAEALARAFASRADATRADRVRLAQVRYWQGHAHIHHNDPRAAIEAMLQVLEVAREVDDPHLRAVPASVIGRTLVTKGQFGQALPVLAEAIAALEQTNDEHEWILALGMYGVTLAARGDYAQGVAQAERALAGAKESNTLTGISLGQGLLGLSHLFGGASRLALVYARSQIETAAQSGDQLHSYMGYGFHAWAQLREGNYADAQERLARSEEVAQKIGGRLAFSDWFGAVRAECAYLGGQIQESIKLAQETVEAASRTEGLFSAGLAHRVWAQALVALSSTYIDEAESHFAESLRLFEQGQARLEAARTRVTWGDTLRQHGETGRAGELYASAAEQFEASGLERELERLRDVEVQESKRQ